MIDGIPAASETRLEVRRTLESFAFFKAAAPFFHPQVRLVMPDGIRFVDGSALRMVVTSEGKRALAFEIPSFAAGWPPEYRKFRYGVKAHALEAWQKEDLLRMAREAREHEPAPVKRGGTIGQTGGDRAYAALEDAWERAFPHRW